MGPPVADPVTPMVAPGTDPFPSGSVPPLPAPVGPVGPPPVPAAPMVPAGEPNILSRAGGGRPVADPGVIPTSALVPAAEMPAADLPPLPKD